MKLEKNIPYKIAGDSKFEPYLEMVRQAEDGDSFLVRNITTNEKAGIYFGIYRRIFGREHEHEINLRNKRIKTRKEGDGFRFWVYIKEIKE